MLNIWWKFWDIFLLAKQVDSHGALKLMLQKLSIINRIFSAVAVYEVHCVSLYIRRTINSLYAH